MVDYTPYRYKAIQTKQSRNRIMFMVLVAFVGTNIILYTMSKASQHLTEIEEGKKIDEKNKN